MSPFWYALIHLGAILKCVCALRTFDTDSSVFKTIMVVLPSEGLGKLQQTTGYGSKRNR